MIIPPQEEFNVEWSEIKRIEINNINISKIYPTIRFILNAEERFVIIRFPRKKFSEIFMYLEKFVKEKRIEYIVKDKKKKEFTEKINPLLDKLENELIVKKLELEKIDNQGFLNNELKKAKKKIKNEIKTLKFKIIEQKKNLTYVEHPT